jgi:hypothetical protein
MSTPFEIVLYEFLGREETEVARFPYPVLPQVGMTFVITDKNYKQTIWQVVAMQSFVDVGRQDEDGDLLVDCLVTPTQGIFACQNES